jgi:hypothetical protein
MLAESGGGTISVESAVLEEMAAKFLGVASGTSSVRGSMSGVASAADGCAGPVAGSFARLQSLVDAVLNGLDTCSVALSRATSGAAAAYVTTDGGVFSQAAPEPPVAGP